MKVADIRKLPTDKLALETTKLREEIADLRRRMPLGEVTNVRAIRLKRKDLARMLSVLSDQLRKETAV
jgi:ribosomal protein L29